MSVSTTQCTNCVAWHAPFALDLTTLTLVALLALSRRTSATPRAYCPKSTTRALRPQLPHQSMRKRTSGVVNVIRSFYTHDKQMPLLEASEILQCFNIECVFPFSLCHLNCCALPVYQAVLQAPHQCLQPHYLPTSSARPGRFHTLPLQRSVNAIWRPQGLRPM